MTFFPQIGSVLNVICLAVVSICINTYGVPMFDLNQFPAWADGAVMRMGNETNICGI